MGEETQTDKVEEGVFGKVFGHDFDIFETRLQYAIELLEQANAQAEEFNGRRYTTVANRVMCFRKAFGPLAAITTDVQHCDDNVVRASCTIALRLADGSIFIAATGHAEEWRESSEVNMTSALENAETSAIGRALGSLGLHGGEFATAEEVLAAKREIEELKSRESTQFLSAEEIQDATKKINACKDYDELSEVYLKFSPALKVATVAIKDAKLRSLNAQQSGSEPEKGDSPQAPSEQQSASPQRRGRKPGAD